MSSENCSGFHGATWRQGDFMEYQHLTRIPRGGQCFLRQKGRVTKMGRVPWVLLLTLVDKLHIVLTAMVLKKRTSAALPYFQCCKQPVSIHQDSDYYHVVSVTVSSIRNVISAEYMGFNFQVYKSRKRQHRFTVKSQDAGTRLPSFQS